MKKKNEPHLLFRSSKTGRLKKKKKKERKKRNQTKRKVKKNKKKDTVSMKPNQSKCKKINTFLHRFEEHSRNPMGKEVKKKSDEKVIIPDFFTIGQKCDESHDQSAEILPKGYYLLCIRAFFI